MKGREVRERENAKIVRTRDGGMEFGEKSTPLVPSVLKFVHSAQTELVRTPV